MKETESLLLAYLRKCNERNLELKKMADNLRSELNYARKSRDMWREKAKEYQRRLKIMDSAVRQARNGRELWKSRAQRDENLQRIDRLIREEIKKRSGPPG